MFSWKVVITPIEPIHYARRKKEAFVSASSLINLNPLLIRTTEANGNFQKRFVINDKKSIVYSALNCLMSLHKIFSVIKCRMRRNPSMRNFLIFVRLIKIKKISYQLFAGFLKQLSHVCCGLICFSPQQRPQCINS